MSRRPFVAGNWKMHKTGAEAAAFAEALRGRIPAGVDVAVCPPFTALADTVRAAAGSDIAVYAQNMHQAESGAFTGEVSAAMLVAAGVDGVLIGHSERRQLFGETDAAVNEKAARAHAARLHVILAVGETAAEREGELTEQVLERQVRGGLHGLDPEQVAATPQMAQAAHAFIRGIAQESHGVGERVRIQYGGSVKPGNAAELFAQPDIDGGLIGGASLEPDDFAAVVAAAAR
jgi:triosephosphate isomerase